MLMKECAGSGESHGNATLRAHSGSVERSLERIGDEGASQAGYTLSLSFTVSLVCLGCLSTAVVVS